MRLNELIAPKQYNVVDEIEKYVSNKTTLKWQNEYGDHKEITYQQLIDEGNRPAAVMIRI